MRGDPDSYMKITFPASELIPADSEHDPSIICYRYTVLRLPTKFGRTRASARGSHQRYTGDWRVHVGGSTWWVLSIALLVETKNALLGRVAAPAGPEPQLLPSFK